MRVRECWYLLRLCCSGVDILRTSFHLFGVSCAERNGLMATGGKIEQKHLVLSLFYALAAVYSLIVSTPETTIDFRLSCAVHRQHDYCLISSHRHDLIVALVAIGMI